MPKDMIADFIASKIRSKNSDLSNIELNDMYINQDSFEDTLGFTEERSLNNYPLFIKQYFSDLINQSTGKKQMVHILCMSAIRVCDVARALKPIKGGSLKLIQKNKLAYDKKAIEAKASSISASTPGRTFKLLSEGILNYSDIGAVVVDSSFLDVKVTNVLDLNESIGVLKDLAEKSKAKVYFY